MTVTRPGPPRAGRKPEPALRYALKRYLVSSLIVLVVVGIGTVLVARALAADIALREATTRGAAFAHTIVAPLVNDAVRRGSPAETERLAALMRSRIGDGTIVHIKIWNQEGTVVWSDETAVIGRTFKLEPQDAILLGTNDVTAAVSDLSKAENVEERSSGELLEVYAGAHDADNVPFLFESYSSTNRMMADRESIVVRFGFLGVGTLLLFQIALLPLAVALARRVDRARADRNTMLRHALSASDLERRRISRDLHDGLIQDLSGLGYALPSVLEQLPPEAVAARRILGSVSVQLQHDVTALRSLLTEIYPADLSDGGLVTAIEELAQRARESGLQVDVAMAPEFQHAEPEVARLVYRVVREALRNVVRHAHATCAVVVARVEGPNVVVSVTDDGTGIDTSRFEGRVIDGIPAPTGHVGLRLLADTISDIGGRVQLTSPPRGGTTLTATFPLALAADLVG